MRVGTGLSLPKPSFPSKSTRSVRVLWPEPRLAGIGRVARRGRSTYALVLAESGKQERHRVARHRFGASVGSLRENHWFLFRSTPERTNE
jgi:hypothetical protein